MAKVVAVIPLLLGSTRLPEKSLILVDGEPMAFYVIRACMESGAFDEIWINSSDAIFESFADQLKVRFYQRPEDRGGPKCWMVNVSAVCEGTRCQVHDHYLYDFATSVPSDYIVQVHATSPTLEADSVRLFVRELVGREALFSVVSHQVEAIVGDYSNFDRTRKTPTQDLPPTMVLTWGLSGWRTASFLRRYDSGECPTWPTDSLDVFTLSAVEAIDVDDWDGLFLAEAVLAHRRHLGEGDLGRYKFDPAVRGIERGVIGLLKRDGISRVDHRDFNQLHTSLDKIIKGMGEPPWSVPLIYTNQDQVYLIAQRFGGGCRRHYHVTKHEWWIVLVGAFEWRLKDGQVVRAQVGDVVSLPPGESHVITCVSDVGVRLACGGRMMEHIYV